MTNNNEYTYMWQPQSYISWKGTKSDNGEARNLFNIIMAINKRPVPRAVNTTGQRGIFGPSQQATSTPAVTVGRNSRVGNSKNNKNVQYFKQNIGGGVGAIARNFGPQPLKHWRLQLNTVDNISGIKEINENNIFTGSYNKLNIANLMDRPGSAFISNKPKGLPSNSNCSSCDPSGNGNYLKEYYNRDFLWGIDISFSYPNDKWLDCSTNDGVCKPACVACNPENNIIKSAVTLINKYYYTDSRAYLRSRCKTFEQKQNITSLVNPNAKFIPGTNQLAWPTDNACGPQTYYIGTCPDKCQSGAVDCNGNKINRGTSIYKPNNVQFNVQGAVDSSSRIAKLKYDTITKNGASFSSAFGLQGANAGKYSSNSGAPYFIKNKIFNLVQCNTSSLNPKCK